jgi:DNA-binding transcriptional regulator YdaS (Cro superfamily)
MNSETQLKQAVDKAIAAAGNQSQLAKRLGVSYQSIQQWKRIPAGKIAAVSMATGIPRHELRPDIFGEAQQ